MAREHRGEEDGAASSLLIFSFCTTHIKASSRFKPSIEIVHRGIACFPSFHTSCPAPCLSEGVLFVLAEVQKGVLRQHRRRGGVKICAFCPKSRSGITPRKRRALEKIGSPNDHSEYSYATIVKRPSIITPKAMKKGWSGCANVRRCHSLCTSAPPP